MQIHEAVLNGEKILKKLSISNARNEAIWFMEKVLDSNASNILLNHSELEKNKLLLYFNMIKRRSDGEPFQLINEECFFYGKKFKVKKNVFIPRQDTEVIIDIIKAEMSKDASILEIGTGTGCIAITLALENNYKKIIATDINKKAIFIAKKNAEKYELKNIKFIYDDIFNCKINERFDLIISNPPYIPYKEINTLSADVKNFDPHNALTDYKNGYTFYKKFSELGMTHLSKDGKMIFEIGDTLNIDCLKEVFNFYRNIYIHKDLNKKNRFIEIIK